MGEEGWTGCRKEAEPNLNNELINAVCWKFARYLDPDMMFAGSL